MKIEHLFEILQNIEKGKTTAREAHEILLLNIKEFNGGYYKESMAHDAVLAEVSSVDEARDYLKTLCYYKFKDKTFINYIENKLAGDFAVEIANVFIRDRNARNFS